MSPQLLLSQIRLSIDACMNKLETMDDLDDVYYNKVLDKIKDTN